MDMISLIIGMKLGGGGGSLPLGEADSEYRFNDLGLTWENSAEVSE